MGAFEKNVLLPPHGGDFPNTHPAHKERKVFVAVPFFLAAGSHGLLAAAKTLTHGSAMLPLCAVVAADDGCIRAAKQATGA